MKKVFLNAYYLVALLGFTHLEAIGKNEWKEWTPFQSCSDFKVFYLQKRLKKYILRIPKEKNLDVGSSSVDYFEEFKLKENYSFRRVSESLIQNAQKVCPEVDKFYHDKLSLPFHFNAKKNFFHGLIKILASRDLDNLIDSFNSVGGKRYSHKFVKNLIVDTAKDSCITPSPPGLLSLVKTENIAVEVSDNYKNMSLTKLNKKRSKIEKEVIIKLVRVILKEQISDVFEGQNVDIDKFISNLNEFRLLQKQDFELDVMPYLELKFSVDVVTEIAKKSLPIIMKMSFFDKIPKTLSLADRKTFFESVLLKKSQETLDTCLSQKTKRISTSDNDKINFLEKRTLVKEGYCLKFPSECKNTCEGSVNLLSNDPGISDVQVAKSCVMSAMLKPINELIGVSIKMQKSNFQSSFEWNKSFEEFLQEKAWKTFKTCLVDDLSRRGSLKNNISPEDLEKTDSSHFIKTGTDVFEASIYKCSDEMEKSVTRDFVKLVLLNNKSLSNIFNHSGSKKSFFYGKKYNRNLLNASSSIIEESLDKCLAIQDHLINSKKSDLAELNSALCAPIVEMKAAQEVIINEVRNLKKSYHLTKDKNALGELKDFRSCSDKAFEKSFQHLGKSEEAYALKTTKDAQTYLVRNSEFYKCTKNVIINLSAIITRQTLRKSIDKISKKTDSLAQKTIKECFRDQLSKNAPEWNSFMEYNNNGGVDKIKNYCEKKLTEVILPKIIISETGKKLSKLKHGGLIKNSEAIGNIIALSAYRLREKYNISLNKRTKANDILSFSFYEAYKNHIRNTGHDIDTFISEYESIAQEETLKNIYEFLKSKVKNNVEKNTFNNFFNSFDIKCVSNFYKRYHSDIENFLNKLNSSDNVGLEKYVVEGLNYIDGLDEVMYKKHFSDLKNACKRIDSKMPLTEFLKVSNIDFIIKAQIKKELNLGFKSAAYNQCLEELNLLPINADKNLLVRSCKDSGNTYLVRKKFLSFVRNDYARIKTNFIFHRLDSLYGHIKKYIDNSKNLDYLLFSNRAKGNVKYISESLDAAKSNCLKRLGLIRINYSDVSSMIDKFCSPMISNAKRKSIQFSISNVIQKKRNYSRNRSRTRSILDDLTSQAKILNQTKRNAVFSISEKCLLYQNKSKRIKCTESNGKVMDFINKNFLKVINSDKNTMKKLTLLLIKKLFQNSSAKSFGDRFARVQITGGLGISGIDVAKKQINYQKIKDSIGRVKDIIVDKNKALKSAKKSLKSTWNVKNIDKKFNWYGIDLATRNYLIGSMVDSRVVPSALNQRENIQLMTDLVDHHSTKYIYKNGQSFSEMIEKQILESVQKADILGIE